MALPRRNHIDNDYIDASFDGASGEEYRAEQKTPTSAFGGLPLSQNGTSLELKVVRPEKFEDVLAVADHLIAGRTVVIDFEISSRDTVKRIKDFLGGVAYSINGQLQKVANNTYIATPNNVDVSEDKAKRQQMEFNMRSSETGIDDIDTL